MKKRVPFLFVLVILLCATLLFGCNDPAGPTPHKEPAPAGPTPPKEPAPVEQIGQVPEAFKQIIQNNLFKDAVAFEQRLLKTEICAQDEENNVLEHRVLMSDLYGNELAAYTCRADAAYNVTTLTATADGGFLFVLGFIDYSLPQGGWASDAGFASRVIKCDQNGNLQFDTALDQIEGASLRFCFEKGGRFYFFGNQQTPETDRTGVGSPTDIYMAILDHTGAFLKSQTIAGTDFDNLDMAEMSRNGFLLSICSQSDDGAFAGSDSGGYGVEWVIEVDDNLEIIQKRKTEGRGYFDKRLGFKDGVPFYASNSILKSFDAGTPRLFIDYGDFYLIVSENNTGIYENQPPFINAIWYYKETVYTAYEDNGDLIFRASVDSSPDYDAWAEELWEEVENN